MASKDYVYNRERRAERLAVDEDARLRPNDWSSLEVRMVDLSRLGFRAQCEARLQSGSCVSLEIPGIGPVEAQVEWRRGEDFGARFLSPIDLDRCLWTPVERDSVLAQLLVECTSRADRGTAERRLRRQILSMPMHPRGSAG
jgi:hypothetical protein